MKKILLSIMVLLISSSWAQATKEKLFPVPYPPFSKKDIFPCMNCHEGLDRNKKVRKLKDMHEEINVEQHGDRWCYDCHDERNLDKLRLANGQQIRFQESYILCGQCHGNVFEQWKNGIHGKRTGFWNGEKQYLLCVHCHDPHTPRFKAVKPDPAPIRPDAHKFKKNKH